MKYIKPTTIVLFSKPESSEICLIFSKAKTLMNSTKLHRQKINLLGFIQCVLFPLLFPHHLHFDLHRVKPQKMGPPTDSWEEVLQQQYLHEQLGLNS